MVGIFVYTVSKENFLAIKSIMLTLKCYRNLTCSIDPKCVTSNFDTTVLLV